MLESMRKLTKFGIQYPSTLTHVNPDPRIGTSISVVDFVNSKLETINPAMAYAPITSTVTFTPTQSFTNFEAQLELLQNKRQIKELVAQADRLRTLKSSAVSLQGETSEDVQLVKWLE